MRSVASTLQNAGVSLRKAKRKMNGLVPTEQNAVRARVKKEKDFNEIVTDVNKKTINEESPEELQELQGIANAIKSILAA